MTFARGCLSVCLSVCLSLLSASGAKKAPLLTRNNRRKNRTAGAHPYGAGALLYPKTKRARYYRARKQNCWENCCILKNERGKVVVRRAIRPAKTQGRLLATALTHATNRLRVACSSTAAGGSRIQIRTSKKKNMFDALPPHFCDQRGQAETPAFRSPRRTPQEAT